MEQIHHYSVKRQAASDAGSGDLIGSLYLSGGSICCIVRKVLGNVGNNEYLRWNSVLKRLQRISKQHLM